MVKLEDIKPGAIWHGLAPNAPATIIQVQPVGQDALTVYYKVGYGAFSERMRFRHDEPDLSCVEQGRLPTPPGKARPMRFYGAVELNPISGSRGFAHERGYAPLHRKVRIYHL